MNLRNFFLKRRYIHWLAKKATYPPTMAKLQIISVYSVIKEKQNTFCAKKLLIMCFLGVINTYSNCQFIKWVM